VIAEVARAPAQFGSWIYTKFKSNAAYIWTNKENPATHKRQPGIDCRAHETKTRASASSHAHTGVGFASEHNLLLSGHEAPRLEVLDHEPK